MEDINICNDTVQTSQIEKMLYRKNNNGIDYIIPIRNITRIEADGHLVRVRTSDGLEVFIDVHISDVVNSIHRADTKSEGRFVLISTSEEVRFFDKVKSEFINRINDLKRYEDSRRPKSIEASFRPLDDINVTRCDSYWPRCLDGSISKVQNELSLILGRAAAYSISDFKAISGLQSFIKSHDHIDKDYSYKEIMKEAYYRLQRDLIEDLDNEQSNEP